MEYPSDYISMEVEGETIKVARLDSTKNAREQHALYRTLANNMFVGVSTGFEKKLKLIGVGYKAAMQGSKAVSLSLGKAHPDICEFPVGVTVKVDSPTELTVSGYDKCEVGNFAAIIRSKRKPEPYKGKGIRYADEVVIQKEGKRK
jgi:large subunit ribosomal protein L6